MSRQDISRFGGGSKIIKTQFLPWRTYPNTNNINLMPLKCMSLAWATYQNCTFIFNCVPDISTWTSGRHLKLKMPKATFLLFPSAPSPLCLLPHLATPPFPFLSPKALQLTLMSFFLLYPHSIHQQDLGALLWRISRSWPCLTGKTQPLRSKLLSCLPMSSAVSPKHKWTCYRGVRSCHCPTKK